MRNKGITNGGPGTKHRCSIDEFSAFVQTSSEESWRVQKPKKNNPT
jgi:hypothetical protein